VAVDSNGNVFVTGESWCCDSSAFSDYATVAYSGAGVPLWTNRYNGPGNGADGARAIAVDRSGKVFVTGYSDRGGFNYDYATVAYSGAGVPLWTNRYNGPGDGDDKAFAVAVDRSGNVLVAGSSTGTNGGPNYATVAYSGAGVPLWTNRYNGPGNSAGYAQALAVDSTGNAFVTGPSTGAGGNYDYATVAYSNTGAPLWTNRYHGPGNDNDEAWAIAVDSSGNVFVTGEAAGINGGFQYATVAYSGAGVPLWTNRYQGPGNADYGARAVALDSNGDVFVTGCSLDTNGYYDYATVAYSGAGIPLWTNRYNGPRNLLDCATAVAVDRGGGVFVTGGSSNGNDDDYVTIKYAAIVLPIPLDFQTLNDQLVLSWTNPVFSLQSAPIINGNYTNIPGATSPYTNSITGSQRYFRLKAN